MKSAFFKISPVIFLLLCMSACSGGGKQGSETNVTLKIGATDTTRKSLFASPSPIPSIVKNITISITASDITTISQTIPITSSTQNLVTTFSVPNGTARVITVTGTDNWGNTPYTGISSPLDLTGSDTSLQIQMIEDVKAAITAKLMQYFKDTVEPKAQAGTLIDADLDLFYSTQFGLDDGMTRALYIAREVKDFSRDFKIRSITSLQINTPQPDAQNIKYKVTGKGIFSDGSYGFPDDGFFMMKEDGEWKFVGNGFKSEIKFRSASLKSIGPGTPLPALTGLAISIHDPGNVGIYSASITSSALPAIEMIRTTGPNNFTDLGFSPNPCPPSQPGTSDLYCLSDATINSIPANTTYTFTIKDVNNSVIETRTITLPVRPLNSTELTAGHFPTLSVAPTYPQTPSTSFDGHFLADARIGASTGLTIAVGKPTAFAPSWLEAHYHHFVWSGIYSDQNVSLLLSATSATFAPTPLPTLTNGASTSVTAEDFDNRREFRTYWQFNGSQATQQISFGATSNIQISNGVSEPFSSTIWKFGDPSPIVIWSSFFSYPASLDFYLLADDPAKIASPLSSGNPFPNVIWRKLNTAPLLNGITGTGSFTLPDPPEKLGITGNACRLIVVDTAGGYWALSQPFTIGP